MDIKALLGLVTPKKGNTMGVGAALDPGVSGEVNPVYRGQGYIYEKTFEIGNRVIAIANINSMTLIDTQRVYRPVKYGVGIAGFALLMIANGSTVSGALVFLCAMAFTWWWLTRKLHVVLRIRTSDGERTSLVSKDRELLQQVCSILRQKMDAPNASLIGYVDLSNNIVSISNSGTLNLGNMVVGAHGTANIGRRGTSGTH